MGLADGLEKLNIPTTIVMREPVANRVAEEFFNYFLQEFAFENKSLYSCVQQARRRLQGLENDFPGASWLPVIFTNPAEEPPTWLNLKEKFSDRVEDYILNNHRDEDETEKIIQKKRQDWGEAIDISQFYGRNDEIETLEKWVIADKCRLITIIGMGGIGKTALSVKLAESVENEFDCLIWRSLRNAPPIEDLLSDLIGFLSSEHQIVLADSLDKQISQLIDCLRDSRCLIVLDNLESILDGDSSDNVGNYQQGYQGYGQLLRCVGDTRHQSCVLVTSREKPRGLSAREGNNLPVRFLALTGLNYPEAEQILAQKGLSISDTEINSLVNRYSGNPLALKIAATTIEELFDSDIADFFASGTIIFGDIFDLLHQQFHRLSILEQQIMYWLAINREWISLKDLQSDIIDIIKTRDLIRALETLQSRCLIEKQSGKFTLQPVVMEYVIEELIEQVTEELYTKSIHILNKYALVKAQTKDYLRKAQIQFILKPITEKLSNFWTTKEVIKNNLNQLLSQLKSDTSLKPGFVAGNIINLLRHLR